MSKDHGLRIKELMNEKRGGDYHVLIRIRDQPTIILRKIFLKSIDRRARLRYRLCHKRHKLKIA